MSHKIFPCLWFDGKASEAATFYTNIFPDSKIVSENPMVTTWEIVGNKFMGLNGGPMHSMNAAISVFVSFTSDDELTNIWNKLTDGGTVLMALDTYPWSEKYGWVKDKYGLTWQLMKGPSPDTNRVLWLSFLFANTQYGHAEQAINQYALIFKNSAIHTLQHYGKEDRQSEGKLMYGQFSLNNTLLSAMDGPGDHDYSFSEGISLVITCDDQQEIEHYWSALTQGGSESMCGWLKDQYGVSWQVVPAVLETLMSDPTKAAKASAAFLKMKKFDISQLIEATETSSTTQITVTAQINAPIQKVWDTWTDPHHITQWNSASPDWHTPKASHTLISGGTFTYTLAAKDGSFSFDYAGVFDTVHPPHHLSCILGDGRKVSVQFTSSGDGTLVTESFDAENENPIEMQRMGWQAILDNFKKYVEGF